MEQYIDCLIKVYIQGKWSIVIEIASSVILLATLIFYIISNSKKNNREIYYERLKLLRENVKGISGQFVDCKYDYDEHFCTLSVYNIKQNYDGKKFFEKCINTLHSIFDILESKGKLYAFMVEENPNRENIGEEEYKSIEDLFLKDYNQESCSELKSKYSRNAELSYIARFFDIKKDEQIKNYSEIKCEKEKINFCIKILRIKYSSQIDGYFHRLFLALDFVEDKFKCSCNKNRKDLAEQMPFQMSLDEIKLMFYYCFFENRIKKKIKRYNLLKKYINKKDLIREEHATLLDELIK